MDRLFVNVPARLACNAARQEQSAKDEHLGRQVQPHRLHQAGEGATRRHKTRDMGTQHRWANAWTLLLPHPLKHRHNRMQ